MDSNNEIPSDAPEMCLPRAVVMQAWADLWDAPLSVHEADTAGSIMVRESLDARSAWEFFVDPDSGRAASMVIGIRYSALRRAAFAARRMRAAVIKRELRRAKEGKRPASRVSQTDIDRAKSALARANGGEHVPSIKRRDENPKKEMAR